MRVAYLSTALNIETNWNIILLFPCNLRAGFMNPQNPFFSVPVFSSLQCVFSGVCRMRNLRRNHQIVRSRSSLRQLDRDYIPLYTIASENFDKILFFLTESSAFIFEVCLRLDIPYILCPCGKELIYTSRRLGVGHFSGIPGRSGRTYR